MRSGVIVVVALIVIVGVVLFALRSRRKSAPVQVRGRTLLTANELDFLLRLEAAVPEIRFHAQVAMGALLEPAFTKGSDARLT